MEKITVIGYIGSDAEAKAPKNYPAYWQFTIGVNRAKADGSRHSTWYKCNTLNEGMVPRLKRGSRVVVVGSFRVDEYTDREGKERVNLTISTDYIQVLAPPKELPPPVEVPPSVVEQQPLGPHKASTVEHNQRTAPAVPPVVLTESNLPRTPNLNGGLKDEFTNGEDNNDLPF